ncbi:hypothetical protein [Streptomyces sp. NPDC101455]|uniref:hypothetical protein n=1 Tax=Streptomyces sp. NPDC101455 TaxID=3366142 RepID=UPI003829B6E7
MLGPPIRRAARRRPVDGLGLPLSTHAEAASAYRNGLDRVLKVRAGAEDAFARAVALDPGFALGHAALALLGHECGAAVDVPRTLADAQRCARERADERERSFAEVITRRVQSAVGHRALIRHLDTHPADALALAAGATGKSGDGGDHMPPASTSTSTSTPNASARPGGDTAGYGDHVGKPGENK